MGFGLVKSVRWLKMHKRGVMRRIDGCGRKEKFENVVRFQVTWSVNDVDSGCDRNRMVRCWLEGKEM